MILPKIILIIRKEIKFVYIVNHFNNLEKIRKTNSGLWRSYDHQIIFYWPSANGLSVSISHNYSIMTCRVDNMITFCKINYKKAMKLITKNKINRKEIYVDYTISVNVLIM